MMRKSVFLMIIIHYLVPLFPVSGQEPAVLAVLDLQTAGIPQREKNLFIDLLSYNIFETERVLVIDRRERDKLLKGLGFTLYQNAADSYYREIGELLQADFIVRGSIAKDKEQYNLNLTVVAVRNGAPKNTFSHTYKSWRELLLAGRVTARELLKGFSKGASLSAAASKLITTLLPIRIKERILFVSPLQCSTPIQMEVKQIINLVASGLLTHKNVSVFITSLTYDISHPDMAVLQQIVRERDCHAFAVITGENNREYLSLFTADLKLQVQYRIDTKNGINNAENSLVGQLAQTLDLLPQSIIINELDDALTIDEKIEPLLFNEKILSHHFSLIFYQKFIKSALLVEYHPLFNLIDLEADFIWHYNKLFGIGLGCGYAYSYPALIDPKLADHPLVSHFELRAIPFQFRTGGAFSLILNVTTSLHMHNAYKITYFPDESHTYTDETTLFFFRLGLNLGMAFNISEQISVYVDAVTLSYAVPLTEPPNKMTRQPFSGDIGGIGIIYRF
ncbi:MAG: hypothetical protein P8107_06885 [Spirochaetia bacterium]